MSGKKLTGLQSQSFAAITKDKRCRWSRHQCGHPELQVTQRDIAGEQQVTLAENVLLAHVHQRDLLVTG